MRGWQQLQASSVSREDQGKDVERRDGMAPAGGSSRGRSGEMCVRRQVPDAALPPRPPPAHDTRRAAPLISLPI